MYMQYSLLVAARRTRYKVRGTRYHPLKTRPSAVLPPNLPSLDSPFETALLATQLVLCQRPARCERCDRCRVRRSTTPPTISQPQCRTAPTLCSHDRWCMRAQVLSSLVLRCSTVDSSRREHERRIRPRTWPPTFARQPLVEGGAKVALGEDFEGRIQMDEWRELHACHYWAHLNHAPSRVSISSSGQSDPRNQVRLQVQSGTLQDARRQVSFLRPLDGRP